jgi:G3E family GTPase
VGEVPLIRVVGNGIPESQSRCFVLPASLQQKGGRAVRELPNRPSIPGPLSGDVSGNIAGIGLGEPGNESSDPEHIGEGGRSLHHLIGKVSWDGIGNFVYERRIPFHPQRFYDCLQSNWPGVIRSKGVFWLATRLKMAGSWSQAGAVSRHECGGYFWAALPQIHWPEDRTHIERVWKEGNGDCRQELVLIGRDMDPQALTTMLDECLLTDEELSTDEGAWHLRFTDPFPEWTLESDGMAG